MQKISIAAFFLLSSPQLSASFIATLNTSATPGAIAYATYGSVAMGGSSGAASASFTDWMVINGGTGIGVLTWFISGACLDKCHGPIFNTPYLFLNPLYVTGSGTTALSFFQFGVPFQFGLSVAGASSTLSFDQGPLGDPYGGNLHLSNAFYGMNRDAPFPIGYTYETASGATYNLGGIQFAGTLPADSPEPSTVALFSLSLLVLLARRRRRATESIH